MHTCNMHTRHTDTETTVIATGGHRYIKSAVRLYTISQVMMITSNALDSGIKQ